MIVIFAALLGALIGFSLAKKRGGKTLDVLQYSVIYALIFALVGLFATLIIHRMSL